MKTPRRVLELDFKLWLAYAHTYAACPDRHELASIYEAEEGKR